MVQYGFFPLARFKEVRMKWLLLLTILSNRQRWIVI